MKNRGLLNPFSKETLLLFIDNYSCWECGRSDLGLEPHHILKRISNSPFNLVPLCYNCHKISNIHSPEKQEKYLKKTYDYLIKINYKLNKNDLKFLKKYGQDYKNK